MSFDPSPGGAGFADRLEIRQLIDDWALWRDSGEWDRLATLWHSEGRMVTTWCTTSATDFVARSRKAWSDGMTVLHTLGGTTVDVVGDRAVAQTRMQITQRAPVHGIVVDVQCNGRFWDALEREEGAWRLRLRQPIYDFDRMTPVNSAARLTLDPALLARFPEGYRHLAYLQSELGFDVSRNMPGTRGPEVEGLLERGARWLRGSPSASLPGGC